MKASQVGAAMGLISWLRIPDVFNDNPASQQRNQPVICSRDVLTELVRTRTIGFISDKYTTTPSYQLSYDLFQYFNNDYWHEETLDYDWRQKQRLRKYWSGNREAS
jgi:hypothetical protein